MGAIAKDHWYWNAVLALDRPALTAWAQQAATGAPGTSDLDRELAGAWLGLLAGDADALTEKLGSLFSRAASSQVPRHVIEVTALRALVSAATEHLSDAISFARRASLMARTEAEPGAELLANLVLARMRRHAGKPHLAVRILDALARLVPEAPTAWLEWERLLAGGTPPDSGPPDQAARLRAPAAAAGRQLLLAARDGRRDEFERAADDLLRASAVWRDIHDEARALIGMLDADRAVPESMRGFRHGRDEALRYALHGTRVIAGDQEPGLAVFAVARPGEAGRRILVDGLGLFRPARALVCEDGARRTHARSDAGLAALVLAGPDPIPEETFFHQVYGFTYAPGVHRGVLDVLLHRMRKRVDPSGHVVRAQGGLHLALSESLAVADPRCSPPAAARVLSALARQPLATAEALAGRLGITVRGVQMALRQLVGDG